MEKNIILSVNESNKVLVNDNLVKAIARITKGFGMPLEWLRKYYSQVIEKEITTKQTMLLLETQSAFVLGIFPVDCSLILRAICGGWFVWSLLRCKKEF